MGKTKFLTKGPISAHHFYERAKHFLRTDPDLQGIANDFTPEMFTVEGIEVLGTPLDTEDYIKNFVDQNCIKIIRDVEKLEPLTDGFTHCQLIQKIMNTRTQFMSANIPLPSAITNAILKKGTRNSFHLWPKEDYDLSVTILQMTH
jgi:hypothetical protein